MCPSTCQRHRIKSKCECVKVCIGINTHGSPSHTHLTHVTPQQELAILAQRPLCVCVVRTHTQICSACVCACASKQRIRVRVSERGESTSGKNVCNPLDTALNNKTSDENTDHSKKPVSLSLLRTLCLCFPASLSLSLSRTKTHLQSGGKMIGLLAPLPSL